LFIAGLSFLQVCFFDGLIVLFSAGVGRSGTFIALDALLETAEHQDTIDILDFTHRMR
jgi:protein tyrosine phosphatase